MIFETLFQSIPVFTGKNGEKKREIEHSGWGFRSTKIFSESPTLHSLSYMNVTIIKNKKKIVNAKKVIMVNYERKIKTIINKTRRLCVYCTISNI